MGRELRRRQILRRGASSEKRGRGDGRARGFFPNNKDWEGWAWPGDETLRLRCATLRVTCGDERKRERDGGYLSWLWAGKLKAGMRLHSQSDLLLFRPNP